MFPLSKAFPRASRKHGNFQMDMSSVFPSKKSKLFFAFANLSLLLQKRGKIVEHGNFWKEKFVHLSAPFPLKRWRRFFEEELHCQKSCNNKARTTRDKTPPNIGVFTCLVSMTCHAASARRQHPAEEDISRHFRTFPDISRHFQTFPETKNPRKAAF